jgi:PAS domain S-box-containing protein
MTINLAKIITDQEWNMKPGGQADEKVRAAEQKYRSFIETTNTGYVIIDTQGRVMDANQEYVRLTGRDRLEEVISRNVLEWTAPYDQARNVAEVSKCVELGFVRNVEIDYVSPAGKTTPIEINATVLQASGELSILTLCRDVTERKQAEGNLELFKNLLNKSNDAVFVNQPQTGRFIDVNDKACISLGYERAELLNMGVSDIETLISNNFIWQDHVSEVRRRGSLLLEGMHKRKDGTTFPVEASVSFVALGDKEYMIAVVRDITERKRSEAALRARESQLAESQRIAHIGSWEHNLTTGQVFWSQELFRLVGLDPKMDRADFNLFFEMVYPDDQPALKMAIDETIRLHKPLSIDYRIILRNSSIKILHAQAELIHDDTGTQMILSGTCQDITDLKKIEEELREKERKYRSLFESAKDGIFIQDETGFTDCNLKGAEMYGLKKEEIIGRSPSDFAPQRQPDGRLSSEVAGEKIRAALGGITRVFEWQPLRADGTLFDVEITLSRLELGGKMCLQAIVRDISERKRLEQEHLKTQKLESIGTLAGGIAHDFNNLLQGVFGYISLSKLMRDNQEKSLAALEEAEKALHISVQLTNQLLTFSKGGKPVKKPIDLQPAIENAAKFALSGSRTDFCVVVNDGLWQTNADEGQISQVIQNIVLNADQAMPEGGRVMITARNVHIPGPYLPQGLKQGRYVEIAIRDAGVGIADKYIGKIFDPYFTTKEKGSGLGLATCYSIIKNHNGVIDVKSEVGKGTTFNIYLPSIAAVKKEEISSPTAAAPGRTGRVLIMDDEPVLLDVAGELIRALGHSAEFASQGKEAIVKYRKAQQSERPFDVVILDLTIRGGMGGTETLQRLLELDPGVKAIVSSGYSDDAVLAGYQAPGFKAFLKKPYNVDELRETLERVLNS